MPIKILLFGGTSYVAQFVCARFLDGSLVSEESVDVACTVRSAETRDLPRGFVLATASESTRDRVVRVFPNVSLLEMETVTKTIDTYDPDVIINCIALSSPAACERDPATAAALNNPRGLIAFLARRTKPLHYLHFSTDFVYGGVAVPSSGYRELDAVVSPSHCVYSATKLAFDNHVLALPPSETLRITVLRIANVVGGRPPCFSNQPPKFVEWLVNELLGSPAKHTTPVRLWKDEVRSFLFVEDLVRVLWRLIQRGSDGVSRVVNVGGVDALSRVAFAERFLDAYGRHDPGRMRRPIDACARAAVDLGYQTPLDARLDCSALSKLLPDFAFTTTDEIMRELCSLFHQQ